MSNENPTPEGVTIKRDKLCADCGGYDIEWMRQCYTHKGIEFCRHCSCPYCDEEEGEDYDDDWRDGDE